MGTYKFFMQKLIVMKYFADVSELRIGGSSTYQNFRRFQVSCDDLSNFVSLVVSARFQTNQSSIDCRQSRNITVVSIQDEVKILFFQLQTIDFKPAPLRYGILTTYELPPRIIKFHQHHPAQESSNSDKAHFCLMFPSMFLLENV